MSRVLFTDALNIKISRKMRKTLDALCERGNLSKGSLARLAIYDFLAEHGGASGEELTKLRDLSDAADFIENKLGSNYTLAKKEGEKLIETKT